MRVKISPLDKLFSEFIRRRAIQRVGGCERCLNPKTWKQLQCSHFHGRRKKSVRWNEDNAAGLCFSCHQHLTENPLEHTEYFQERLGESKFEMLNLQANTPQKPNIEAITLYLKEAIRNLTEPP